MSTSTLSVSFATKTLLPGKLELCQMLPISFEPDLNTTLNYKYGVYPDRRPEGPTKIRYLGYGIKGRYQTDDEALTSAYKPSVTNMDAYKPIPFRLVPADEDLSNAERAKYRMRVKVNIEGIAYVAYYLKVIDFEDKVNYTRIDPRTQEESVYELDPTNLNPVPQKPSTSGTVDSTIEEVKASVKARVEITGREVSEAIAKLYKGNMRYAMVSELMLYTGEDINVTDTNTAGGSFSYMESIYTQLAVHSTFNGVDLSHPSAKQEIGLVFTSGSPFITMR